MFSATIQRYRAAYAGLPRDAWLLALVLFVNRCGTMVVPFMTLYLTHPSRLGMSEAAAGRMIGVFGLGCVCGAYLGGRLAERFGAIRVQTVCMFLAAPGYWIVGVWDSWPPIAVTLFLLAMAAEAVRTANATAIATISSGENRTRAFALNRLAANLGFSFGPVIGGALAMIDFSWLFLIDAATTFAAAVALLAFFRMRRDHVVATSEAPPARVSPLADRVFVMLLVLFLVNLVVFFQFSTTYPLYLRDHYRLTEWQIGTMFAVNTTVIVLVEMVLLDAIKHWPLVRTIGWGCFLSCLGFGMLPFGASIAYAVLAMVVVTVGEMLSFSLLAGFVASRSPRGCEGSYMGWYTMTFALASVLGPAVGSAIYGIDRDALWYGAIVVGAGVLASFLALATREEAEVGDLPETAAAALVPEAAGRPALPLEPLEAAVLANAVAVE